MSNHKKKKYGSFGDKIAKFIHYFHPVSICYLINKTIDMDRFIADGSFILMVHLKISFIIPYGNIH